MAGLLDMLNAGEDPMAGAPPSGGYGGLLSPQDQQAARQQALLTAGAQLMSSGGWSPQRQTFGQALGPAIIAGLQARQQATSESLKAALIAKQLQEKKADLVAVIGPDGKPQYIEANKASGMEPYNMSPEAKATAPIQEYNLYASQVKAAGQQPMPYMDFLQKRASANAQYPYAETLVGGVPTLVNRTSAGLPPAPGVAPAQPTARPLSTLPTEANAKGTLAGAEAGGRTTGEKTAGAAFDLPRVEDTVTQALNDIDQLKNHPGLKYITGMYSKAPVIPGTQQAAADSLAKQIQGQTFLQAYNQLRGGGQITEVEGQKATAAVARIQQAQSTDDYKKGLDELAQIIKTGRDRARKQAGTTPTQFPTNPTFGQDPNDPLGIRRAIPR